MKIQRNKNYLNATWYNKIADLATLLENKDRVDKHKAHSEQGLRSVMFLGKDSASVIFKGFPANLVWVPCDAIFCVSPKSSSKEIRTTLLHSVNKSKQTIHWTAIRWEVGERQCHKSLHFILMKTILGPWCPKLYPCCLKTHWLWPKAEINNWGHQWRISTFLVWPHA